MHNRINVFQFFFFKWPNILDKNWELTFIIYESDLWASVKNKTKMWTDKCGSEHLLRVDGQINNSFFDFGLLV